MLFRSYYPLEMIKVELGFYGLRYWGANTYPFPSLAYQGIPEWEAKHYQKGFHALPWLRAQVRLSDQFQLVMGNIYGAANHKLMAPLYNPELNLTADPEVGVQLLFESAPFDLDLWLNWESFIFYGDTHQEVFTIGLSTNLKLNNPESRFHFYMPLQGLIQHRGGEIDTITMNSVNTLMNGGIGFGATWNTGCQGLKRLNVEVDALGYYQQAGKLWPFESGMGIFAQASADVRNFRFKGGYWWCHNYISMFGNPFFGSISTSEPGVTFHNPSMIYLGAEYSYEFAKGFAVGGEVDVFESLPVRMHGGEFEGFKASSKTSFSAGIYLRVTPSFLLWKGKK